MALLVDLFCGAGGCSVGYHRAGFAVVGVDNKPQPRYPFEFHQADALEFLAEHGREFDVIHASPPCQCWSVTRNMGHTQAARGEVPDLLTPTLELLREIGQPWVIENVPGAPLPGAIMLCGLMFGLKLFRHRLFGSNVALMQPSHAAHGSRRVGEGGMVCMAGHGDVGRRNRAHIPYDHRSVAAWRRASGIEWMTRSELAQAIPPAYTEFVGWQLLLQIGGRTHRTHRTHGTHGTDRRRCDGGAECDAAGAGEAEGQQEGRDQEGPDVGDR